MTTKKNNFYKIIVTCFLAICIEMYDFMIFAFLLKTINKNYLSFMDKNSALFINYLFFAIGFVFRPIGSLIFGYIGDKYGRRQSLVISISLMGVASLSLAILPSYNSIGIISCYLIGLIRVVQGISVGGEYSGAIIYAIEQFDEKKAGFIGGIVVCGSVCGTFLAILMSNILQSSILPAYSWRFAFFLGFSLAFLGYFIRKDLLDTPDFKKCIKKRNNIPLLKGFKKNWEGCLSTIFIAGANGVNFYFILVFFPNFLNRVLDKNITFFPIITTCLLMVFAPLFCYFSDRIGRKKMIQWGLITIAIFNFFGIYLLSLYPSMLLAILFFCAHAIIFSVSSSIINIYVVEIFSLEFRFSCSSFFYSIGVGFIGGTSPMVASFIIDRLSYSSIYVGLYVSLMSVLGYLSISLKKTSISAGQKIIVKYFYKCWDSNTIFHKIIRGITYMID